jgi:hypothetical protein
MVQMSYNFTGNGYLTFFYHKFTAEKYFFLLISASSRLKPYKKFPDSRNLLLTYDPASGILDFFYKEILHPYFTYFYWGELNFLYMINGNNSPVEPWTVYRVDTGMLSGL